MIKARKKITYFTRKRKIVVPILILYILNRRGLTNKMELEDFIEKVDNPNELPNVTASALLKQRMKLNPEIFVDMNDEIMRDFYTLHSDEVKTFKGYVLTAEDGSDWEVPNTPETRKNNKTKTNQCARMKVSNCYDLLNKHILDTQVESYKYSEIKLAQRHLEKIDNLNLLGTFKSITVRDRGYSCLRLMYDSIKSNQKFVVRAKKTDYKYEQSTMTSDDEWVEIGFRSERMRHYKDKDPELYEYFAKGNTLRVRIVKVKLKTGEIEILLTNLESEEFNTEDIVEIYRLRWGIETSYHHLKENMKMTNISSSKLDLIKQDIYSQMLVANMLQAIANEAEAEIDQEEYKHKMKVNMNMAIGYIKRYLLLILLEKSRKKRNELYEELEEKILKNIIPIREGRTFDRSKKTKNKHHSNKRKSF